MCINYNRFFYFVLYVYSGEMGCKASVLVVFDVDAFKQINDSYGHVQGDLCLAEIAECIKKAYANFGYCYRIGGDEFCVLLKNADKEDWCKQEFLHRLEEKLDGQTDSIGVLE